MNEPDQPLSGEPLPRGAREGPETPESDAEAPTSAADAPGRHTGRRVAVLTGRSALALLSVAVLVATAAGWLALDRIADEVSTSTVLAETAPSAPVDNDSATDILLVGSDSRTDAQGDPLPLSVLKALRTERTNGINTDTLILVRVPHNGRTPTAVSIPRDAYVPVTEDRSEKINAVYGLAKRRATDRLETDGSARSERIERESALAGQRALVRSVQTLTGTRIDHYAEVNLLGFHEFTEAIGGVEVCLKKATSDKDSGADFSAGRQTIRGGDALAFVRQRHGLPRGDLDRIVRQQVFMAALANKVLSSGTLTDSAKLRDLMSAAKRSVVLDETWDIPGFAQQMQSLATGSVEFVTLPVEDATARNDRGQSIVAVDRARVREFVTGLANEPTATGNFTGSAPLRLDGSARPGQPATEPPPISSAGVPCVN
ncbi:LCP family protein [Parasphingorhabdus pacifica]